MTVEEIIEDEKKMRVLFWQKIGATTACTTCATHGCCKELVAASGMEVFLLLASHGEVIDARWDALVEQASRELLAVESGMAEAHQKGLAGMPRAPATHYFDKNIPCALRDEGKCSVYDLRPIPCVFEAVAAGTLPAHCEPEYTASDIPHLNCWSIHKQVLDNYRISIKDLNLDLFPSLPCVGDNTYPIPLAMSILYHVVRGVRVGWWTPEISYEASLTKKAGLLQTPWMATLVKGPHDRRTVW